MELEINQIDFTIAINTFHDDSFAKIQYLTKLELDFLRKFQSRVNFTQYHSQMIFQIRKIVNIIQEVFKDVQDYFYDLKIGFAYELMRKIQTLMVIGYNHLSQALLITFDIYERQKNKQVQVSECSCNGKKQKKDAALNKDERKKLEHIDYTISSLQSEQQKLALEMQTMYDRMLLQKNLIDKIKPSLAIRELQQMKDHLQTVMQENQKIFQQNFMMQFFQLHNQIKKIDKPQEINELYKKINSNLKDNFVKHIVKTAGKINQQRKKINNTKNCVQVQTMDLILSKTKSKKQSSPNSVNNSILKASSFNINAKERKAVMQKSGIELNQLKKTIESLNQEIQQLKQENKKQALKFNNLESNYNTIQSIYQQVRGQLQIIKSQSNWKTQKLITQNKLLKNQLSKANFYRPKQELYTQTDMFQYIQSQQTQTHQQYSIPDKQNQIIKLLKTRNEKAIIMINQKDKKIRQLNNQNYNFIYQIKILKDAADKFIKQTKTQFQINLIEVQQLSNATAAIIAKTLQQTFLKLKQFKHLKFQSKNRGIKKSQFKKQSRTSLISQTQIIQINQNDQYQQEDQSNQLLKTQQSQKSLLDTVSEYISMQDRKKRRISASNIFNLNKPKTFNKLLIQNNQKQIQTQLIWHKNKKFQQFFLNESQSQFQSQSIQKKQYFININKKCNLLLNNDNNNDEGQGQGQGQKSIEQSLRLKQEPIKAKTHRKYLSNINNNYDISQIQMQNSCENSSLYLHSIRKSSSKFKKINITNRSSQKLNKNKNKNIKSQSQNEKELMRISKLRISSGLQMMKKKSIPLNNNNNNNNELLNGNGNGNETHRRMNSTAGKFCFQNLKMDFNKYQNSNNQIRNNISRKNKASILASDIIEQKKQSLNIFSLAKEQSKLLNVNVNMHDQKEYAGNTFTSRQGFQQFGKFKQSARDNRTKMTDQNFDKQNINRPNVSQNVKKRSLLLSVQKYKENTQSLLIKELTRIMERFGKDKIKECYQKILTKQKNHIFNSNFMGTI